MLVFLANPNPNVNPNFYKKETIFVLKWSIFVKITYFVNKLTYMHGPVLVHCPAGGVLIAVVRSFCILDSERLPAEAFPSR